MSINKFDHKSLKQINEIEKSLNEGFIGSALVRLVFGGKAKKVMKTAVKAAKDDPELQAAFIDLKYHTDRLQDLIDSHCDEFPTSKNC